MVFVLINLSVEEDERPACRLCAARLVDHHVAGIAEDVAAQPLAAQRPVYQRLCRSPNGAVARRAEIEQRIAIPAIGLLLPEGIRVKRIGLRAHQDGAALIAGRAFNDRHIGGELVLHHRISGDHVAAEPDVAVAQAEQRIVIPRRRAENEDVIPRAAPQKGHALMARIYRLNHRRSLSTLRLPERLGTSTGRNVVCQRLQRRAFWHQHLHAW